jgi:hypothetical protein
VPTPGAAAPAPSPSPSSAAENPTPSAAPTPAAVVVPLPASCTESYPASLVERTGSGFLSADAGREVNDLVENADVAARLSSPDGLRCRWRLDAESTSSMIASAVVPIAPEETSEIAALLRTVGASCVTVRSGVLCIGPVVEGDSLVIETHMLRDGLWAVHVGGEDTAEYAAAMSDVLYGEVEALVPST